MTGLPAGIGMSHEQIQEQIRQQLRFLDASRDIPDHGEGRPQKPLDPMTKREFWDTLTPTEQDFMRELSEKFNCVFEGAWRT